MTKNDKYEVKTDAATLKAAAAFANKVKEEKKEDKNVDSNK